MTVADKKPQSKSERVVIPSCLMAGRAIGMALLQPFRLGVLEAGALGAIFGGIGAGLGALVGHAIAGLSKLSRPPVELGRSDNAPAAGSDHPLVSPQPPEMDHSSDLDAASVLDLLNHAELPRSETSKSTPNDNLGPDVAVAVVGDLVGMVLLWLAPMRAFIPIGAAAITAMIAFQRDNKTFRPMVPALAVRD